jgi:hypothetical protein
MKYTNETSLRAFKAWAGGKYTLDVLRASNDCESVERMIKQRFHGKMPSEEEVNNFLWFDRGAIAEHLGFASWEAYDKIQEERWV